MTAHVKPPVDPVADAVADSLADVLVGAVVSIAHTPAGSTPAEVAGELGTASATAAGPSGWYTTITVRLEPRVARLLQDGRRGIGELLDVLPAAGLQAAAQLRSVVGESTRLVPAVRRAVRDTLAAEILAAYLTSRLPRRIER